MQTDLNVTGAGARAGSHAERAARRGGRLKPLRLAAFGLFALAALLRVGLVDRQGLWADELFSLGLATGHSLEHPAAGADPAQGDYVEAPGPLSPAAYARYLDQERPPAGPARVVRAVFLSDTSPPLYYLLLNAWTRQLGTSDAALRLFSVAWALACFPLLWSLARQLGGRTAAVPACLLFAVSPLCVFYSTEGRMYSLLWFWTVATMWLTSRLWREGFQPGWFFLWVAAAAAGLLTHYFFVFVWAAALAWLLLHPGRLARAWLAAGVGLTGLLVLPWYLHLPESLANWRVTGYWLNDRPSGFNAVKAVLYLPWSYLSIRGVWGGRPPYDWVNCAVFLALAGAAWWKLSWSVFSPRRRLLWFWLLGACLGPVVFDWLRGTYVVAVPRYVLAGMPAAFLLVGLGLGRLPRAARAGFATLIVLACLVGLTNIYRNDSRDYEPTREVGRLLAGQVTASDVVIVHSIPSGVAGIARYLDQDGASARGVGFASWVGQLHNRRVPEDIQRLVAGRGRVVLVKLHHVGEPAPEEDWLRQNATLVDSVQDEAATVLYFAPRGAEAFAW